MVLWLKLGKLIVIRTLKGRWNELVILSLGQTSALDISLFPQMSKCLKIKSLLLLMSLPLCHHSNDCTVCPLGWLCSLKQHFPLCFVWFLRTSLGTEGRKTALFSFLTCVQHVRT